MRSRGERGKVENVGEQLDLFIMERRIRDRMSIDSSRLFLFFRGVELELVWVDG